MAILINDEENILFELRLLDDIRVGNCVEKNDTNWFGGKILLKEGAEIIESLDEYRIQFSNKELRNLISNLYELIEIKKTRKVIEKEFSFITSDDYILELIINETGEDELLEVILWLNIGYFDEKVGYKKGFCFLVDIKKLFNFTQQLEEEFTLKQM